jgi:hypothetical protein
MAVTLTKNPPRVVQGNKFVWLGAAAAGWVDGDTIQTPLNVIDYCSVHVSDAGRVAADVINYTVSGGVITLRLGAGSSRALQIRAEGPF